MRTFLASAALMAATAAAAHEGHGASGLHSHAFDIVGMVAVIAAIGWWLWQRSQR